MSKKDDHEGLQLFQPYRHSVLFAFAVAFTLSPEYTAQEHQEIIPDYFTEEDNQDIFRISTNVFAYNIHKGLTFDRECKVFSKAMEELARITKSRIGFGISNSDEGDEEFFYVVKFD
jgi:hypothetical protein